jgi:hypothetical protein
MEIVNLKDGSGQGGDYVSYRCDFCYGARRVSPFNKWRNPSPDPVTHEDQRLYEAPPESELRKAYATAAWSYWERK